MTYRPFDWAEWIPENEFRRSAIDKIAAQQGVSVNWNDVAKANYYNNLGKAPAAPQPSKQQGEKTAADMRDYFYPNASWQAPAGYSSNPNAYPEMRAQVAAQPAPAQGRAQGSMIRPIPANMRPIGNMRGSGGGGSFDTPVNQAPAPAPQAQPAPQVQPAQRPAPQAQPAPQQQVQPARITPNQRPQGVPNVNNQNSKYLGQVAKTQNSQIMQSQVTGQGRSQQVSNMIARGRQMSGPSILDQARAARVVQNNNTQQTNSAAKPTQSGVAPKAQISSGGQGGTQPTANPKQVVNASTTPNRQIQTTANSGRQAYRPTTQQANIQPIKR